MDLLEVVALGVALGADSLSVSIGIGMGGVGTKRALKLAALFGGLQGVLLAFGAIFAAWLHRFLEAVTQHSRVFGPLFCGLDTFCIHDVVHDILTLIGAGILTIVGVGLIRNYTDHARRDKPMYYKGCMALLLLALSVSMDALSAGVGLGMIQGQTLSLMCMLISLIIALMALMGLKGGRKLGRLLGRRAEFVGGCLLMILALHLAYQVI